MSRPVDPGVEPVGGEDAARLLDRVAGAVPVAPAPVGRVVDAARRLRRRQLLTSLAVLVLLALVLAAFI